jgi:hypothetical protein
MINSNVFRNAFAAAATLAAVSSFVPTAANATTYTYVGSWAVDDGPYWDINGTDSTIAYSGVTAAAYLFGGSASDYVTSTVDSNPADINFMAWISTWGGPGGGIVSDTFVQSTGGLYSTPGDTSTYVSDWTQGSLYTNYAFSISTVPETSTWVMLLAGFAGLALAGYGRHRKAPPVLA